MKAPDTHITVELPAMMYSDKHWYTAFCPSRRVPGFCKTPPANDPDAMQAPGGRAVVAAIVVVLAEVDIVDTLVVDTLVVDVLFGAVVALAILRACICVSTRNGISENRVYNCTNKLLCQCDLVTNKNISFLPS
jgi:hypothetical protein